MNPIINKKDYFDLFISRTYIKFHLKSPKIFMDFDLLYSIDPFSTLNKTIAFSDHLEIALVKATVGEHWESLLNPDKASAKQRREESFAEMSQKAEQARETAQKKKIELDRLSVSEQMRIDGEKRKVLEDKLENEKTQAVREIFSSKPNTQIFKDRVDLPETRQNVVQSLKFTAKRDPNLPARESTASEPPIPNPLRPFGGPIQDTHPLFLKDKGDEFFKNEDFVSAINAYNKALKTDGKYFEALMNLSVCYMKIAEFDKALESLNKGEEVTTDEKAKGLCLLRKAACFVWKGNLADGLNLYRQAYEVLQDDSIVQDIIVVEKRRESNLVKLEADKLYAESDWNGALQEYLKAAEIDEENELIYANLAQVSMKLDRSQESLAYCDKALELLTHNQGVKLKVLLRKAKITEDIKFIEEALMIDPGHTQAKQLLNDFKEKIHSEQFESIKKQADELLKSGKASEAQGIYRQLLSTCKVTEVKISLLTNISACQLLTKDFHGVVTTVQRAFKLNPKPSVRLRLFCRRGKAYAEMGQLYSAQCDLKEALILDPDNETIRKDLQLLLDKNNN